MIRRAKQSEHSILTAISFRAKAHWPYPTQYFEIWKNELTITSNYIDSHEVYVYEDCGSVWAYYSLVELHEDLVISGILFEAGLWLDHMFVVPQKIGQGIGRELFHHCLQRLHEHQENCLKILADPYAKGFYEHLGCNHISNFPSTIPGRTTPYLQYILA